MKIKRMRFLDASFVCIILLVSVSGAATLVTLTEDYTVGGAIYTDLTNPLASGETDVIVTLSGVSGTYTAASSGSMGIWQIDNVPEGTYTVTPSKAGMGFQHLVGGVSDGLSSVTITVNATNMAASQSIQFLAGESAQYSLDVSVIGGHGSVSADPDSGTYLGSTQVSLIATPEDGYRVATWDGIDDGSTAQDLNRALVTMTADKAVTVEFQEIPPDMYTLTVEQPEGGSISASPVAPSRVYAEGTIVTLIALPDPGHQVKAWTGTDNDPAVGSVTNTVTVTEDITVTVEFEMAFTIGGAIYTDLENPLTSGLSDVTVTVSGVGKTYTTATSGSQGIWQISNLHAGAYTITPSATRQVFEHVTNGTSDEQSSVIISVNSENRADNQSIQFLAVEPQADNLVVTKMKLKAGKSRLAERDSITVSGLSFDASSSDFENADDIYVDVFSAGDQTPVLSGIIPISLGKFRRGKFIYRSDGITAFKCDLGKHTFSITAKKVNLTRLSSPVTVRIEVGDYLGSGIAYDGEVLASGGTADVINGRKPVPMQFMMGHSDSLRVDKCRFKLGTRKPSTDSLIIQGAIAVEDDSINLADKDITVRWGNYAITLPADNMYRIGHKKSFKYKKPKGSDSSVAAAIFDLEKCTFKLVIKKAVIGSQDNPVDLAVQFGQFDETVPVPLARKKVGTFVYP